MKQLILTSAAMLLNVAAWAQTPAFPGAEGHGRYVTGGRGGKVVHVTNLNDRGPGSFRAAVSGSAKKTIVFDVGGVIALSSDLSIGANTTVMGQTAPYPGITLRYYTVRPGSNNIVRFIRVRRGQERNVNDGADAVWNRELNGFIIDHCSFSWSIDEVASFYDNNNTTLQWSTIGESLNNAGHGKGAHGYGGIWGGKLASFHHNFIAHVNNRAPRFNGARYNWAGYTANAQYNQYHWANAVQAENVDFRNCVVFNWGGGGCYGGPGGGQVNMVNNYYEAGPATTHKTQVTVVSIANKTTSKDNKEFWGMTSRYYIAGNYVTAAGSQAANYDWKGVSYDGGVLTYGGEHYTQDPHNYYGSDIPHMNINGVEAVPIRMSSPVATGEVTTHSAVKAYKAVLNCAGASLFRDDVDARYMTEAESGKPTYKGKITGKPGLIDVVADVKGYTEADFPTGHRSANFDTDGDGMPDNWELANGLDPNDASDATLYTLDARHWYTNLEVYANSLVEDLMKKGNADAETQVDEYYPTTVRVSGLDYYTGRQVATALQHIHVDGIEGADSSAVIRTEYYNLSGQRIAHPVSGVCLVRQILANGKQHVYKKLF